MLLFIASKMAILAVVAVQILLRAISAIPPSNEIVPEIRSIDLLN